MVDNGCQPAAVSYMTACGSMSITPAFTSYNHTQVNADPEQVMRTMKKDLVWIQEWKSQVTFMEALEKWVTRYNQKYLHSALVQDVDGI